MKPIKTAKNEIPDFDFSRARKPTKTERAVFQEAVRRFQRRGRPPKKTDKYRRITIRIHPQVLTWAKAEARKRKMGYQTFINETLLADRLG